MRNITNFCFSQLNKFDKIFVLVSGGIDSTYLYEIIKQKCNIGKVFAVNCYNPFEQSDTLRTISKENNYIQVKFNYKKDYNQILKESFLKIPEQMIKYNKHKFECCNLIKKKDFLKSIVFKQYNTVVISGIKPEDSYQRRMFLRNLREGIVINNGVNTNFPSFYHKHKTGQLYCYPFRDYKFSFIPELEIDTLRRKYPKIEHSGCSICPVLVVHKIIESKNYIPSLNFAKKLGIKL